MPPTAPTELDFPTLTRELPIVLDSWEEKTRSFDIVLSTGARVRRSSWWDGTTWDEELSLEDGHVRTDRLRRGVAVLVDHGWTVPADGDPQVGIAEGARFETIEAKRSLLTRVTLSGRKAVEPIADDVKTRIKRHVSTGYKTWKQRLQRAKEEGEIDLRTAIDWEPLEGSLVAIPADMWSGTRNERMTRNGSSLFGPDGRPLTNRCVVVVSSSAPAAPANRHDEGGSTSMPAPNGTEAAAAAAATGSETRTAATPPVVPTAAPPGPPPAAADANRSEGEKAGAARARATLNRLRAHERSFKLESTLVDELAKRDDLDERSLDSIVLEHVAKRQTAAGGIPAAGVVIGAEPRDHVRNGITQTLEARVGLRQVKELDERGRHMHGSGFVRLCEEFLRADGVRIESIADDWVLRRAIGMIGTSDLPKLLENIQQKSLQAGYDAIPTTWDKVTGTPVSGRDFKQRSTVHRGLGSQLAKVLETGEIPFGSFKEGGEKYAIEAWGLRVPFTFQAMRNDDLDSIGQTPRALGIQAAMTTERELWALVSGNAVMADGIATFHATHKNEVASGADFKLSGTNAEKGLQEMQRLLRVQVDDDGLTMLGLAGELLIVPAALDVPARKLTTAILSPTATGSVNVFSFLKPLVVAQLDGAAQGTDRYYLAANPALRPLFEVAFLDGSRVPIIDSMPSWEQDGIQWRCRWYFGGVIPNHRGAVRNIGQTA